MPEAETHHYITEKDLGIIKAGGRNYLFDIALATFGAALGFFQNFVNLISILYDDKVPDFWTFTAAMLFLAFSVATVCLYVTNHKQSSPLDKLVEEIESRPQRPYGPPTGTPDGTR